MASLAVEAFLMFDGVQAELFATSLASIVKLSDLISDFFFIHDLVNLDQQVAAASDSHGEAEYTYVIGGGTTTVNNNIGGRFLEEEEESSSSSSSRWLPVKTYIALASIFTIVGVLFDVFLIVVAIKEHRTKKAQEKEHQRTASDVFWQEGLVSSTFWSKAVGRFFESDATQHQENWVWWRHANFVLEEIPQLILLVVFYVDWSRSFADSSTNNNSDSYWQQTKASIFVSAAFTSIMVIKVSVGYILYRRNRRKWQIEQEKANAGIMASILSTPSSSPQSQQSNTTESKKRSILCKSATTSSSDLEEGRQNVKEGGSGSRWSFFPSNTPSPSRTKKGQRDTKQKAKPMKDNSYSSSFFTGLKDEECNSKQPKRGSFTAACSLTNIQGRRPTPTARIIADAIQQRKDKKNTVTNNNNNNNNNSSSSKPTSSSANSNKGLGFSTMSLIPLGRTDSTCSSLSKSSSTSTSSKRKRRQQKASNTASSLSTISTRLFTGVDHSTDNTPDSYFGWLGPSSNKSIGSKSSRSSSSSSRDVGVVSPPCCGLLP